MEISSVSSVLDLQQQLAKQSVASSSDENFNSILTKAMASQEDSELKEACNQMEAYILSMLFKQMKSSMLSGESLIGKGDYEEMFEDTYIDSLCENMVSAGGVGLSDAMYRQMTATYSTQMEISNNNKSE